MISKESRISKVLHFVDPVGTKIPGKQVSYFPCAVIIKDLIESGTDTESAVIKGMLGEFSLRENDYDLSCIVDTIDFIMDIDGEFLPNL